MLNRHARVPPILLLTMGCLVAIGLVLVWGCREAAEQLPNESRPADRASPPSEAPAAGEHARVPPTESPHAPVEPGPESTRTRDPLRAIVISAGDAHASVFPLPDLSTLEARERVDNFLPMDRMDEVERTLIDMWSHIETLRCTVKGRVDIRKGMKHIMEGGGTYDYRNEDGNIQIRLRLLNSLSVELDEEKGILTGQKILKIYDGEFLYELQEMHAGAVAHKRRARPGAVQFIGGEHLIAQIHRYDDVRLLDDQIMGEEVMYVYRTSKDGGRIRADYYIHQRTGLLHILILADDDRGFTSRTTFNEFYLNGFIPKDRFEFKVPEGVEIKDLTQSVSADTASP